MKATTLKKFLAACLSGVMALCLLTGCGNKPAVDEQTDPTTKDPVSAGMLILSADAAVNITYDANGLVLSVQGTNHPGIELASKYSDYLDQSCAAVAAALITIADQSSLLPDDLKNIVVKQTIGSQLPNPGFLEDIEAEVTAAAMEAGSAAVITVIDETMQDENGYINLDTVKALLCNELGVEKLDKYYGSAAPYNGSYICTVEIAGQQTSHSIDAVTGLIAVATNEELLGDPEEDTGDEPIEETEGEEFLPDDEFFVGLE